jgi:hypothetical protein
MPRKPAFIAWYTRSAVLSFFHAVPYTSFGMWVPQSFFKVMGDDKAEDAMVRSLVAKARLTNRALNEGFAGVIRKGSGCYTGMSPLMRTIEVIVLM